MARKLKAFTTSAGFFDLAVSAPSMKAALEAWGAGANLFHQGFARQTGDPAIVKATMARPGIVLRRPVGTDQPFQEEAEASEAPFEDAVAKRPEVRKPKAAQPKHEPVAQRPPSRKEEREAARAFEKERERRERQERQEAAARRKERRGGIAPLRPRRPRSKRPGRATRPSSRRSIRRGRRWTRRPIAKPGGGGASGRGWKRPCGRRG